MHYAASWGAMSEDSLRPVQSTAACSLDCPDVWAQADVGGTGAPHHGVVAEGSAHGSAAWAGSLPRLPSQAVGEGRLRSLGSGSLGSETPRHSSTDAGPVARGWAGVMARASLRKPRGGRGEPTGPEATSLDCVVSSAGAREAGPLYLSEHLRGAPSAADEQMQRRLRQLAATPISYLLRDLLWEDPTARPTAHEALQHPFFHAGQSGHSV